MDNLKNPKFQIPRFSFLLFGICYLEFGIWCLEFGIWCLEFGAWNLEFGAWNLEFGAWNLVLGIWNLEFYPISVNLPDKTREVGSSDSFSTVIPACVTLILRMLPRQRILNE